MRSNVSFMVAMACIALGAGSLARAQDEDGVAHQATSSASIDFVSLGGIENWQPQGNDAILIEGRNGSWYRASFVAPCLGLRFHDSVGFVTTGPDRLDKFSSVIVNGERCWFRSFEKIDPAAPASESSEKR